jgi:hypothetical protein
VKVLRVLGGVHVQLVAVEAQLPPPFRGTLRPCATTEEEVELAVRGVQRVIDENADHIGSRHVQARGANGFHTPFYSLDKRCR